MEDDFIDAFVKVLEKAKCQFKNFILAMNQPSYAEANEENFPSRPFRKWLLSLLPDLLTTCCPFGEDLPDGLCPPLLPVLKADTLKSVLSEASSEPQQKNLLLQSLRNLAIFLPGIGIAQLLLSVFGQCITELPFPTSMSGMIATIQETIAGAQSSTASAPTDLAKTECSLLQRKRPYPDGDQEEEDTPPQRPTTRNYLKKMKMDSSEICSSKFSKSFMFINNQFS